MDEAKKTEITTIAYQQYPAALAFTGLDNNRHGTYKLDMQNTFVKSGVDNLPLNTVKLLKQVTAYQEPTNNRRNK